ncbi:Protein kinase superfamily protein [Abeliophyllum distichum]|uniref:Protein kinase superfamily protein n=1 Tax=Abeliophyllum distichum TaxID=126358 RepID=A0ABD1UQZ6_9LAMI
MSKRRLLCAGFSFKILYLCCTTNCQAQNNSFCVPSSCGDISIRYLFRLKADPENCGHPEPIFMLECQKNRTILSSKSQRYNVHAINYNNFTIRIADPGLDRDNYSSCPIYSSVDYDLSSSYMYLASSQSITLLNCISPINNSLYIENPFCGNKNAFSNSSKILSYFVNGNILGSDLEESCTFDTVVLTSSSIPLQENATYSTIHNALAFGLSFAFGFELSWCRVMCGECDASKGTCIVEDNQIRCRHYCYEDTPLSERSLRCKIMPYLCLEQFSENGKAENFNYYKVDNETIEELLKHQDNLMPIKYSYSEIKKMTKGFKDKLGGEKCGTVFKGNLRSGPFFAIKMMANSIASGKEFINEVAKIGRIRHANVVKLIGFCIEGSNQALVYEFMPNGSLDKYVYSQEGTVSLSYRNMFKISLGMARGINYLHQDFEHIGIKLHNILLDENLNPKISDLDLTKLYPLDDIGGVSYKADIYNFGMMLMEMARRRENMKSIC